MIPLHYAAAGHSSPAVAVLALRGADVSAATAKGVTPLHVAARRAAVLVVRVLLDPGELHEEDHPGVWVWSTSTGHANTINVFGRPHRRRWTTRSSARGGGEWTPAIRS